MRSCFDAAAPTRLILAVLLRVGIGSDKMRILSTVVQNHHRFLLWSLPQLSLSFLIRPRAQQTFATKACSLQSPRCDCEDLTIPADLDIDRQTLLLGTIAAYDTHVLVSTGKSDWNSKIELEMGLAAGIKGVLGKAGLNKGHEDLRHVSKHLI